MEDLGHHRLNKLEMNWKDRKKTNCTHYLRKLYDLTKRLKLNFALIKKKMHHTFKIREIFTCIVYSFRERQLDIIMYKENIQCSESLLAVL